MTTPGSAPLLEMKDIDKSFYGVKVLDCVSLDLYAGEVLALLGQNGAGKSTLIKILNGDYQKDAGAILINGRPVEIKDRKSTRLNSSHSSISYAVFCLKKK